MQMISEFWAAYGADLLNAAILAVIGYIGFVMKRLCARWLDTRTKREVAKTCVSFVEQLFTNLHGQEKLDRCMEWMETLLAGQGISVSKAEQRVWIEAAVREMNGVLSGAAAPPPREENA